jgi:hypothetical protein
LKNEVCSSETSGKDYLVTALYPRKTESSTVDNYVKIDKLGGTCSTDVINNKYEMLLLPLKEKATLEPRARL